MLYFDEERNPNVKAKTLSAIPSVEIRGDELKGCTTVRLKEPLTGPEMQDLQDYLKGQFSDGWGEGFEQQEIQTGDGVLYVHFAEERFDFEVEQVRSTEVSTEQSVPKRPKMKLVGMDRNIFAILGRASRLLKRNGQVEQAEERAIVSITPETITRPSILSANMWKPSCQRKRLQSQKRNEGMSDDA